MAIREILRMGDRRLLAVAEPVSTVPNVGLDKLLVDMFDTMEEAEG